MSSKFDLVKERRKSIQSFLNNSSDFKKYEDIYGIPTSAKERAVAIVGINLY